MLVQDFSCVMSGKFGHVGTLFAATSYYQKINHSKVKIAVNWFCSDNIDEDFFMYNLVWSLVDNIAKDFTCTTLSQE